ncbi:MAG TPA: pitrilysin family protein [Chthonomonadaceae bacterium]|nr:pitrilysin family protein [Chthonomonadaceae bacterium]
MAWLLSCSPAAHAEGPGHAAEFTLPNGLKVVVRERHEEPLVAIDLWVRAGARDESAAEAGAAHFLEHTLFKGTTTRRAGEADAAIENLGATLGAATGPDYARFYTCVESEHAGEAMAVLADVVCNPTLPADEIERERAVILSELAVRDSDPTALLIARLYETLYAGDSYARLPGGTAASIRARKREELLAFYRRTFGPRRSTLVLVGDVTPDRAREIAAAAFGAWNAPGAEPIAANENGASSRQGNKVVAADRAAAVPPAVPAPPTVKAADVSQPMIGVAARGPAAPNVADVCAAQVVAAILGQSDLGGRLAAARLSQTAAAVIYAPRAESSLFAITARAPGAAGSRARPGLAEAKALRQAIEQVLDGLRASPPTAAEVAAAKSALLGRAVFQNETDSGLAAAIGGAEIAGAPAPEAWRAAIEQVSVQSVRTFVVRWLDAGRRSALILMPRADGPDGDAAP